MSTNDEKGSVPTAARRNLKDVLTVVKNREADVQDVVVDMKAAENARLELLAEELRSVIEGVDETDQRFDFGISKGERPRLWIDMTTFVAMGHDKRSYRFLKDTRMGRIVLAETNDMKTAADFVSNYIGEKVVEREKAIEGDWVDLNSAVRKTGDQEPLASRTLNKPSRWRSFFWFMFGVVCCLAALAAAAFILAPDAF